MLKALEQFLCYSLMLVVLAIFIYIYLCIDKHEYSYIHWTLIAEHSVFSVFMRQLYQIHSSRWIHWLLLSRIVTILMRLSFALGGG